MESWLGEMERRVQISGSGVERRSRVATRWARTSDFLIRTIIRQLGPEGKFWHG